VSDQLHAPVALPRGKFHPSGTYRKRSWVGPRAGMDAMEKRNFLFLQRLEIRHLGLPASSQSLYLLRYSGSYNSSYTCKSCRRTSFSVCSIEQLQDPPKLRYQYNRFHGVTFQRTTILKARVYSLSYPHRFKRIWNDWSIKLTIRLHLLPSLTMRASSCTSSSSA
jgi:hypothetical protein